MSIRTPKGPVLSQSPSYPSPSFVSLAVAEELQQSATVRPADAEDSAVFEQQPLVPGGERLHRLDRARVDDGRAVHAREDGGIERRGQRAQGLAREDATAARVDARVIILRFDPDDLLMRDDVGARSVADDELTAIRTHAVGRGREPRVSIGALERGGETGGVGTLQEPPAHRA